MLVLELGAKNKDGINLREYVRDVFKSTLVLNSPPPSCNGSRVNYHKKNMINAVSL